MSEIAKLLESYNVLIVSVSLLLMTLVILNIDIKQLFVGLFLVAFFGVSIDEQGIDAGAGGATASLDKRAGAQREGVGE